ncbi:MAG: hypothetical protein ACRDIB_01420 [Ardenticatenaceae bacterium]
MRQKTRQYNTKDEGIFLQQQAADAKVAMQRTVAEMKVTAKEAADVHWWTQHYPWYAVGAAAVVGFVTATSVLPSSHRRIQRQDTAVQASVARSPSVLSPLFVSLLDMAKSAVMSAIIGAIYTTDQQTEQTQNPETW